MPAHIELDMSFLCAAAFVLSVPLALAFFSALKITSRDLPTRT